MIYVVDAPNHLHFESSRREGEWLYFFFDCFIPLSSPLLSLLIIPFIFSYVTSGSFAQNILWISVFFVQRV